MKQAKFTHHARHELDERFKKWRRAVKDKRPKQGWIREIREALGMSARQLAGLVEMKKSTIAKIEQSEREDRIQLGTLRKVAKALRCDLVYALVPRTPLDKILRDRAFATLLPRILLPAAKMRLDIPTNLVIAMADNIIKRDKMLENPHRLWDEIQAVNGISMRELADAVGAEYGRSMHSQKKKPQQQAAPPPEAPRPQPPPPPGSPAEALLDELRRAGKLVE